jgi:hypothetical protein
VKVRLCAVKNGAVSNRNCVAAMRGGEQRNENDQSVTQVAQDGSRCELDSVGVDGRVCERKTKPATRAIGGELNRRATGQTPVVAPMVGDGMVGSPRAETRETRQCWRERWANSSRSWLAGVRASVVAEKRVTTVEPRDAGRWKCDEQKDGKENQRECPQGLTGGGISRVQLAWVIPNVCPPYLGTRRRAAPSRRRTHRLESRMRENRLSGLEGGGADVRSPYPYPSRSADIDQSAARLGVLNDDRV